jgi:F0F1-type ATP synthase membrane subunit c/vacuolar-type H+-ATPase subunit K
MSIVEKRSAAHHVDYVFEDGEMSATTSICVGLVVALAIYVLGSALLLQGVGAGVTQNRVPAETWFVGP